MEEEVEVEGRKSVQMKIGDRGGDREKWRRREGSRKTRE